MQARATTLSAEQKKDLAKLENASEPGLTSSTCTCQCCRTKLAESNFKASLRRCPEPNASDNSQLWVAGLRQRRNSMLAWCASGTKLMIMRSHSATLELQSWHIDLQLLQARLHDPRFGMLKEWLLNDGKLGAITVEERCSD